MEIDPVSGIRIISPPGEYADGAEDELLKIMDETNDRSSRSDDLAARMHDWPTRYHLSRLRSNILRPLEISPGMRILDVGAGTGAVSRYLGETGAQVVALEGSLARARVALERCRGLDSVEVICGDLNDFEDDAGFDLVVVVGVLEYAGAGPDSASEFLQALGRLTKPDGAVAIAIENQIGLKYLVGYTEDHLGELLVGVEGYPGHDTVRTYSKRSLQGLLTNSGFGSQRWLYPFPDYKLPTVVLSDQVYEDEGVVDAADQLVRAPVQDLYRRRELLTDDRAVHRVFLDAGLGREVANSFLVVAARQTAALDRHVSADIGAWLFGSERMTMWLRDRVVVGVGDQRSVVAVDTAEGVRERGWLRQIVPKNQPFVRGRTLEQLALEACREADLPALEQVLVEWRQALEAEAQEAAEMVATNPFLQAGSTSVLPARYLDSNLDNFIATEDGLAFIDAEWEALGGVDLRMALIRGLWWFAQRLIDSASAHPWTRIANPDQLVITLGSLAGIAVGADEISRWRVAEAELQSMVQDRDLGTAIHHLERLGARSRSDIDGSARLPFSNLRRELAALRAELLDERESLLDTSRSLEEAESRIENLLPRLESAVERARDAEQARHRATKRLEALEAGNTRLREEIRERADAFRSQQSTAQEQARAALATSRERLRSVEESTSRDRAAAQAETQKIRLERDRAVRSYERLRSRRVVRLGLGMAKVMTPIFRLRRGPRSKRRGVESAKSSESSREPGTAKGNGPPAAASALHLGFVPEPMLASRPALDMVTIIVPIYNAYEDVVACIEAVRRNTYSPARLLLIDDASTDERIAPLLETYARQPNIATVSNVRNLGFTGTVNRGFVEAEGDVVVLNSDAVVTPRWLTRLQLVVRRRPRVATVTAVSDNAGAFSVPEIGANDFTRALTADQLGRAMAAHGSRQIPTGPTGNGFCMLIRRAALDAIGDFDIEAFPRGYGEENDFCMRALQAGWEHAIDGTTLVFHRNAASFGDKKKALVEEARKVIDARYPAYTALVRSMMAAPEIVDVRAKARAMLEEAAAGNMSSRPRLLYVLHAARGGTPATNHDLMAALEPRYDPYVLTSNGRDLILGHLVDGATVEVDKWRLDPPISVLDETRRDYREILATIIGRLQIELIHVRHLIGHTFDIGKVARSLGVPVALSFHDFYYVCPTVHLLDETDTFCGGACTAGQGKCRIPTPWLEPVPHLKHEWVNVWRRRAAALMADVDAFVTTSNSARDTYLSVYPDLADRKFEIIEHGRDLPARPLPAGITPSPDGPVKIVVPGNLAVHKGSILIERIKSYDELGLLEFHFLGDVPEESRHLGVVHGPYERHEFADLMDEIGPAFVAVLTIAGETYSHVITEAWAAGIPLLVTALGAQQERILRHGGGWVLDHTNPQVAYQTILHAVADPTEYERRRALCVPASRRTVEEMAADYSSLYERVWHARRPFGPGQGDGSGAEDVIRAGLFVVGEDGSHPGSVHVRTLRRWMHLDLQRNVVARVVDTDRFLTDPDAAELDVVVVQRTALEPKVVSDFIDICTKRSIPIVFDLDDDLIDLPVGSVSHDVYSGHRDSLVQLAERSSLVTISTHTLADRVGAHTGATAVVPNDLDERLWLRPLLPVRSDPKPLELLYFGTDTHGSDLDLLREPLQALRGRVRLHVVGGEPPNSAGAWYERVEIPRGCTSYPRFVGWLTSIRSSFDVGVVPLVDDEFNRCKSDLKYLEMAALGLPVLASAVTPYVDTIRNGDSGMLVRNTKSAWVDALTELAGDATLRGRLREAGYSYVAEERRLGDSIGAYLDLIRGVVPQRVRNRD